MSLNSFYQAGSGIGRANGGQALLFAQLTVVFDRIDQPEIAATL